MSNDYPVLVRLDDCAGVLSVVGTLPCPMTDSDKELLMAAIEGISSIPNWDPRIKKAEAIVHLEGHQEI